MRGRHGTAGWTQIGPDGVVPAQPFGTEAWNTGADGAMVIPVRRSQMMKPPTLRGTAWRTGRRHRRQLVPWLAAPVLPLAVLAGRAANAQLAVIIGAAVLAGITIRLTWPRIYPAALAILGAGWTASTAQYGLHRTPALPAYVAGWFILCLLPWWNRYRIRHQHGKPDGEPPAPLTPDQLLTRLRERVCGQGQQLSGAIVTEEEPITGGRSFLFSLVPGKQDFEHVRAASRAIASAAEVPRVRVVAEPAPGDVPGEDGPANLARVTILEAQNAHREIHEFDGMTLARETGLFDVGPYPDMQMAPARLYKADEDGNPMRAASGLTSGSPGSGKSRYVEHKLVEHLMSGLFKVFFLDGQGGASIPGLLDHVDWPATRLDEWTRCLRATLLLMFARTRLQSSRRVPCWYAAPDEPFVHVLIEEAHKPLRDPAIMRMVKTILQEGEKVGIGLDLVTQFPSQVELGGNSGASGANVIRSMASAGNVVLFRTGDESSKSMAVGAVEVNPRLLPSRPGMCHPLGASMRLAPARAIRVTDPASWAYRAPETAFSDLDLAALGDDYRMRKERFAEADAMPDAATLDRAGLEKELALITGEDVPSLAAGASQERAVKRNAISAVMDILRKRGSVKRADLITELEYTPSSVDQALKALEGTGKVRKGAEHGMWQLALHAVTDDKAASAAGG